MREQFSTIVMTVAVFAGGLFIGIWMHHFRPLPPPPISVMGEFDDSPPPPRMASAGGWFELHPAYLFHLPWLWRAGTSSEVVRHRLAVLRPQITAFRDKVDVIEGNFRQQFEAILTPAQRQKLALLTAHEAEPSFVAIIIYRPALDHFSQALALNAHQQQQLEGLMRVRRHQLLALIDKEPPPSLRLGAVLPGAPKPFLPPAS
jgi:hypothetical protein